MEFIIWLVTVTVCRPSVRASDTNKVVQRAVSEKPSNATVVPSRVIEYGPSMQSY